DAEARMAEGVQRQAARIASAVALVDDLGKARDRHREVRAHDLGSRIGRADRAGRPVADFPGILSRCELDLAAAVLLADLERGARRLRSARLRAVRLEEQGRPFLQAVAAKAVERGDRPPIE